MPSGKPPSTKKSSPQSGSDVRELIIDAYECAVDLSDGRKLEAVCRLAAETVGARVAQGSHHAFQPHGVTVSLILQESHLVLSTWPEYRMAIVNIFLCNAEMDPKAAWAVIREALQPESWVHHDVVHRVGRQPKTKGKAA